MQKLYILLILSCVLSVYTEFADYMQVYEQECLGENRIHCQDGSCIWRHQYCDGRADCLDGSDENACLDHTPEPHLCEETHHFLCADKKRCIPLTRLCNNYTDCEDGSDEQNCTDTPIETSVNTTCAGFTCERDRKCISSFWVCDGTYDCDDRSDEGPDTCRHKDRTHLGVFVPCSGRVWYQHVKHYPCTDTTMCLDLEHMCNGLQDCKDGSDEGDFCQHWSTMCANDTCNSAVTNATCYPARGGAECLCPQFSAFNESTRLCAPLDMCAQPAPYCSQICTDRGGPWLCDCEEGYLKDFLKIGHVCMAPDPEALLFFSIKNEIKYIGLKSKKLVTVATGIKQAHGVSYDGQYLYWVETAQGHQAIMRAHLDNVPGTKQVVVSLGLEDPGHVAVDWLGGNIYLSDAQRGLIFVCKADGALCTTLITDARLPKFLTLDVKNGKMYWADWHHKPVIMAAAMDGSGARVLTDKLTMFAAGLTVDAPSRRLYFVDTTLKGVRLDNGEMFTLFNEPAHQPYAVSVFENYVYWSDWASNTLQLTDKMSGSAVDVLAVLDSVVYGLHMYHPILQKAKQNPCANNPCSHFCLLTSNVTYVCACPDGMELGHTTVCQPKEGYRPQYLVVGGGATFTRIQYDTLGNPETHASRFDIGRVQAMAYDSLRDALYIFDSHRKCINYLKMSNFSRGVTRTVVSRGLENVVDMDYDYITDSLYLVDAGRRFVEVVSLRSGQRAMLHRFDDEVPLSLCVLPDHGKMLIAVSESEQNNNIHIDSFGLDGSGREHILMNNLKGPHIRLRYSRLQNLVYLADEGNSIIDRMHVQGTNRETYRELSTSITNLAVTETLVFWTDRRSSRLYWADVHDTSRAVRRIELSIFPNTTHLHIQSTTPRLTVPYHPCQRNPCSDICVQSAPATVSSYTGSSSYHDSANSSKSLSTGYKCLCPPGLLNVDGSCSELVKCEEEQAYCHNSNVCIRKSALCDGKKDCFHGEDEEDCQDFHLPTSCRFNEMLCNGKCMDRSHSCPTTSGEQTCRSSQFTCERDGVCVERAQMCDGVTDCPDGSDEAHALCTTLNCLHTEFMCASGHCILLAFRCDGESDCYDDSDEQNCANKTCPQGTYRCRNAECVDLMRRCDGQFDCLDHSDEDECGDPDYFDNKEEIENCAEWEYTCELDRSLCLPIGARCNGKPECPGNTDETGCYLHECSNGGYFCQLEKRCVPAAKVCDGHKVCADGADETPSACLTVNRTSVLYPIVLAREECVSGYRCEDGQCVEWRAVCDGRGDCADGTDEGGSCATSCSNNSCSHTCHPTPRGARCACPPGFELATDGTTCVDTDECTKDVCSQHCTNLPGSFLCSCHRGYALRSDRRSCKAVKGSMSVLYVSGNSVRSITADGLVSTEFTDEKVPSITDMDYDVRRKKLYVTSAESGELIEVNSTQDKIVITNFGRPTKVAVDWISGNVYYVDASPTASYMRVCNADKKRCARLQKLPTDADVTALTLDPSARLVFYCASRPGDLESVVWAAAPGGALAQLAVLRNCTGLAADSFARRLYVAETGPGRIVSMDYEGGSFKEILNDDQHLQAPHDLAIFEDHIYYLVANSFKLNRCLLFNTRHCELYLQRVFNANSFVLRHESVQRDDVENVCEGVKCDNVCVAAEGGAVCLCVDGAVSKDGSCPLVKKKELPLFNGLTLSEYDSAARVSVTLVASVAALFLLYLLAFAYYHFVYKRKRERATNYIPVHFQNSMAEGTEGLQGLSPITTPVVQLPPTGSTRNEFLNPLQYFKNLRPSFRRQTRPIGTAGLTINVPNLDVSDTESDIDTRENKQILQGSSKHEQIL